MSQLNDISVFVNNNIVAYEANTLSYKEGFGETKVRNAVLGGGVTEQVFSQDLESKIGMVKFSLPSTIASVTLVRGWQNNLNANVVELMGTVGGQTFTRVFEQSAVTNDPEVNLSADGSVEVEFMTRPST